MPPSQQHKVQNNHQVQEQQQQQDQAEQQQEQQQQRGSEVSKGGRYRKDKRKVAVLEQQLAQLQLQLAQLQQNRRVLLLQERITQDRCDATQALLDRMTQLQGRGSSVDPGFLEALSDQAAQGSLSKDASSPELRPDTDPDSLGGGVAAGPAAAPAQPPARDGVQPSAAAAAAAAAAVAEGDEGSCAVKTISPLSAPCTHLRMLLAEEPVPGAESLPAQQLAEVYRDAVLQSGVLLLQLPQQAAEQQRQETQHTLQKLWDRYNHTYVSMVTMGRWEFVEELFPTNLLTMQRDPEASVAAQAGIRRLLPQLGLTPQQQEVISASYALFARHVERITEQRAVLQRQVAPPDSAACRMPAADDSSSSGSADSGSKSEHLLLLSGRCNSRRVQLDQQQQTVVGLRKLLHTEMVLRMMAPPGILGCLSWEQMARLAVLMWPYIVRTMYFAKAVHEYYQEQQQQQQQQQQ